MTDLKLIDSAGWGGPDVSLVIDLYGISTAERCQYSLRKSAALQLPPPPGETSRANGDWETAPSNPLAEPDSDIFSL